MSENRRAEIYSDLREYIAGLTIIDTHEHLPAYESQRNMDCDVLTEYLIHYFSCDLVSAGLPKRTLEQIIRAPQVSLADKWAALAPYWEAARHTGYGRALAVTARDLYGIDRIDGGSIEELDRRFRAARAAGDCYRRVLKEKSGIETSLLDEEHADIDGTYFKLALQISPFLYGTGEKQLGQNFASFDEYLEAVTAYLEDMLRGKAVCLKCVAAYWRSLFFDKPDAAAARAEYDAMRGANHPNSPVYENYMMHHILGVCERLGAVIQIHTGLQEGNGNRLEWTNPILLNNLFLSYPNVKFDLFHIGYPFQNILSALAKNFPNVYIDMCWVHIISPAAAAAALDEFLDAVPCNKISAFGGDYCMVDAVYGHQYIARDNVAKVLAKKAAEGVFDVLEAKVIARRLFYDNPSALFALDRH